jgi:signal transduction histidine kinase
MRPDMNAQKNLSTPLRQAFPDLSDNEIETLSQAVTPMFCPPDTVICAEGEVDTKMYVLVSGDLGVYFEIDTQKQFLARTMQPFQYFGEMGALGYAERVATVKTMTACEVLSLEGDVFLEILYRHPPMLRQLVAQMSSYVRDTDRAVIRELRQRNDALKDAYQESTEQERLRTNFITLLSHEIRTPLTSVQGYLHLISNGMLKGESLESGLQTVTRNVEKLVHLINHLLVLYEMHLLSPSFETVNLASLLPLAGAEALDSVGDGSKRVVYEMQEGMPALKGDEVGLTLVWRILIENGLKFTPNGTPVCVKAFCKDQNEIQIDVIDYGVGIPPRDLPRIFEPFYQARREDSSWIFSGMGVGLPIAKFIVERHQGKILIESEEGLGSTFSVILPYNTFPIVTNN